MTKSWPQTVEGFRQLAQRRLPKPAFAFVDGGAGDEETLRTNRQQFQRFRFVPRVLVDVHERDLTTSLAGCPLTLPLVFAPAGMLGLVHPDGEVAAAQVAAQHGLIAVVSGHATYSLEEVAAAAPPGSLWFDIFPWRDREFYGELIDRAASARYHGLCITLDTPVPSNREREWASGWTAPPRLLANLGEYALHPGWSVRTLRHRRGTMRNFDPALPRLASFIWKASQSARDTVRSITPSMVWSDLEWARARWSGPLAVKGAFGPEDAKRLASVGVNVLFVGNHGGRQLDGLQPGLEQLPALVEAVGGQVALVVDGGVRRGSDVVKSVCLGASACMIGRPWIYGLAAGGRSGVGAVVDILRREVDMVMALLGVRSVSELNATYLARAP
jgi:isopentenyl diphosphate isomerase/L-lactate dehydrogenase-like FMN-dependent dehydrogenase